MSPHPVTVFGRVQERTTGLLTKAAPGRGIIPLTVDGVVTVQTFRMTEIVFNPPFVALIAQKYRLLAANWAGEIVVVTSLAVSKRKRGTGEFVSPNRSVRSSA